MKFKSWKILTNIICLVVAWFFWLSLAGFTSDPQRIFQLLIIVLISSAISLLLIRSQIKDYIWFKKDMIVEQLSFLITTLIVICVVLLYDLSDQTYAIIFLPILEELFFRGLILAGLAVVNVHMAIIVSSLMFSLTHYFRPELEIFIQTFLFGISVAILQACYKSIFLPTSLHVLCNWYVTYTPSSFYGSGLTYFGGFAVGISYFLGLFVRIAWEYIQTQSEPKVSEQRESRG